MDFCRRTVNDLLDGGRRQGRDPTLRPGTKPARAGRGPTPASGVSYAYVTHPPPASFCRLAQPLVTGTDPEVLISALALSLPARALALWLALA